MDEWRGLLAGGADDAHDYVLSEIGPVEGGDVVKIIGKTPTGYIVEAEETELANLIGYYSESSRYESTRSRLAIGEEIRIHVMFRRLHELAGMHDELIKYQERLLQCATLLQLPDPLKSVPA